MRVHILFTTPLFQMFLVPFPSLGLSMDDLVQRDSHYYKKFTDVSFDGEIDEELKRGLLNNSTKEGTGFWSNILFDRRF